MNFTAKMTLQWTIHLFAKSNLLMKKPSARGGYRPNSGPKTKYGEPTQVIRVPVSLIPAIKKMMEKKKAMPPTGLKA